MLVDLHTHILPGIDDGAKNSQASLALLSAELSCGVDTVVLSPHFTPQEQSIEVFLKRRENSMAHLQRAGIPEGIQLLLGAEVLYSKYLANLEHMEALCISGTRYLLLELPYAAPFQNDLFYAVGRLIDEFDIIPIIVHVERYLSVQRSPALVKEFRNMGCLIQVNAASVVHPSFLSCVKRLLKAGNVDFLASDCHDMERRSPNLAAGYMALEQQFGKDLRIEMENHAQAVVQDKRWWE